MEVKRVPKATGPRTSFHRQPRLIRRGSTPLVSRDPLRTAASPKLCPECNEPALTDDGGELACSNCGTVVKESNNIVAEVSFGETAGGAAVVQGKTIRADERSAKLPGAHMVSAGRPAERGEHSKQHGNAAIQRISSTLKLPQSMTDQAVRIYGLAVANNFIHGRKVMVVAAAALYIASRTRHGVAPMLLVDFAEAIQTNVFTVGQVYADLKKTLFIDDSKTAFNLRNPEAPAAILDIEGTILRYCSKLDFGTKTTRVAGDAARVLKRMRRDWMVSGRQPSGLVGACILIAARMNNYRRTVRELVFVVKACNVTISKRLDEFSRTESSELTVEDFREHGLLLRREAEPPILYQKRMLEEKKKREREKAKALLNGTRDNPETISDHGSIEPESRDSSEAPSEPRRDAEGFAVPKRPKRAKVNADAMIDPSLKNASAAKVSPAPKGASNAKAGAKVGEVTGKRKRAPTMKAAEAAAAASRKAPSPTPSQAGSTEDDDGESTPKRSRGRPKKTEEQRAVDRARRIVAPEDLGEEQQLETEIENIIERPSIWSAISAEEFDKFVAGAKQKAEELQKSERLAKRRASGDVPQSDGDDDEQEGNEIAEATPETEKVSGETSNAVGPSAARKRQASDDSLVDAAPTTEASATAASTSNAAKPPSAKRIRKTKTKTKPPGRFNVSSDYEISESEFASDPEVAICALSEADVRVKERIWTRDNEEWLRGQQTRLLQKMIQEKHDAANGGKKNSKAGAKKRAKGMLGDGWLIKEKGRQPKDAAEAVEWMKAKRQPHSSRIDYKLVNIYKRARGMGVADTGTQSAVPEGSAGAEERAESVAANEADRSVTASIGAGDSRGGTQEPEAVSRAREGKDIGGDNGLETPEPTQQDGTRASQAQHDDSAIPDRENEEQEGEQDEDEMDVEQDVEEEEAAEDAAEEGEEGVELVGYDPDYNPDEEDTGEIAARKLWEDIGEDPAPQEEDEQQYDNEYDEDENEDY